MARGPVRLPRERARQAATVEVRTVSLCGVTVDTLAATDVECIVEAAVRDGQQIVVAHHNLHSIRLASQDERMRRYYQDAEWAQIDGMGVVALGRLLGKPLRRHHRLTYVDLVGPLLAAAERHGWRVAFVGWRPCVVERAGAVVATRFPRLETFFHHGYFDPAPSGPASRRVVAAVNEFAPQLLLVGMGMPRQEHWILDHRPTLRANAILAAGACLDYLAGAVPTPPRLLGRVGLEWLFRLACEPHRLWRRYLVEPWAVARLAYAERAGRRDR